MNKNKLLLMLLFILFLLVEVSLPAYAGLVCKATADECRTLYSYIFDIRASSVKHCRDLQEPARRRCYIPYEKDIEHLGNLEEKFCRDVKYIKDQPFYLNVFAGYGLRKIEFLKE